MVNKQHKNRFFAAKLIAKKGFFVMFPCFGCETTNFDYPEKSCNAAPNGDICSRCVRFGRLCDLFISEFVC